MVRSNHLMDSYGMTREAVSVPSGSIDFHISNTVCSSNLSFVLIVDFSPMRVHQPGVEEMLKHAAFTSNGKLNLANESVIMKPIFLLVKGL